MAADRPDDEPLPGGLRERKKAQTRQHISDTATRLFLQQGFDEVTVAEIAAVADVSVKTVFNYFGSKEDLLFDRESEVAGCLEALAAARLPEEPLIDAMLRSITERYPAVAWGAWAELTPELAAAKRAFYQLVHDNPHLHARALVVEERMAESVRRILSADTGASADDPTVLAYAQLVHAAYAATGAEFTRSLLAGRPPKELRDRSVAAGTEALGRVRTAYADSPLVLGAPAQ